MTDDLDGRADDAGDAPELTAEQEAEVRALLAALPDPPMPDDVAARIDTALAGARRSPRAEDITGSAVVEPSGVWRPRGAWMLQAAAVLVLLLLGAGVTYGLVSRDDPGPASSDVAAGAAPQSAADVDLRESGYAYRAKSLPRQVRSLLAGEEPAAAAAAADGAQALSDGGSGRSPAAGGEEELRLTSVAPTGQTHEAVRALVHDPERRAACLNELTGSTDVVPLLVDVAVFERRPAAVVVLPVAGDPGTAEVWVVGATCSSADEPFPLHFALVPRP